jgi:hypothetical protein
MKSNISYNLFRNRKKFNPLILFYQNKDLTYQEFKEYFNSRHVESPDEDYFNRVKHTFFEKTTLETKVIEAEAVEKEEIVETPKPKRKRKRKTKNEN